MRNTIVIRAARIAALLAAILLTIALAAGCNDSGDALEQVLNAGELRFGIAPDDMPMSFESQGEPAGLSVDLARELAKRLNVGATFVYLAPEEAQAALDGGEIDIYINMPSPGQKLAATLLTVDGRLDCRQIVVAPENSGVSRLYDLKGGRLAVISGSDASDALDAAEVFKGDLKEVVYVELVDEQLAAVEDGRADALLVDEPMYRYVMNGVESDYRVIDEALAERRYVLAFRLHDASLGNRIESLYVDMENDGAFEEIRTGWIG